MGFGFIPLGVFGAVMLITTPQLLAANHVPESQIAAVTATALIPGFSGFLLSPLLDWKFSRRTYALIFAALGAAALFAALLMIHDLAALTALLVLGNLAIGLCMASVGGWFGNLASTEQKGDLGAWLTVANIGAGGMTAAGAIPLLRHLPYEIGAAILALAVLLATPLFLLTPCPPADGRLARESFAAFARDVLALLRRPTVLWTLAIFLAPAASFALTNTLGGLGGDFRTSEALVGLIGGAGVAVAGVAGSLAIPLLDKRIPPRPLYLLVGGVGALFTLSLIVIPHTPASFGLAMLGENVFQAAAFSVSNVIILRTIGHDNPLASTQFALLNAASSLPLSYMQMIDGQAYGHGGLNGSLLADAAVSGAAALSLAGVLWLMRRRVPAI